MVFILIFNPLSTVFAEFFSSWSFDTNKLENDQSTVLNDNILDNILDYKPIVPPTPRTVMDAQDPTAWVVFDMVSREEVVVPSARQTQMPIESNVASTLSNEDVFQMKMKTEAETVLPPDDRSLISFPSTLTSPWSSICKLLITAYDGTKWMGSGSIIGPGQDGHGYHVLTAGHNVYIHDHGGWVTSIIVIPGYDGAQTEVYKLEPFYHAFATGARTYTGWTDYADHRHDLAVLTLDRNIGDFTGWMGRATYPSSDSIYTGVLNTAGYPGDLDSGLRMYYDSDIGRVADEYNHWYYMDTYGGQSGSPVWHLNSSTSIRHILTVHAYGDDGSGSNHGTRLNAAKYDNINTWLSGDTPPIDRPDLCDDGQGWSGFSPTTVFPGVTDFNVYCDVRNFGTSTATSFSVAYYASENEIITSSDYLIGTFLIGSVPPLTYTDSSWNGVFPVSIPPGDYWVGWIIDNENSVTEFDESNNVAYKTSYQLHVSAGGSLEVSPTSGPGGVDVELTGSGYPPSATVTLSYYDSALDLWNVLDTVTADPSGDIAYTTEVPDLRRSGPPDDNAEMYALVSYRSEVGGAVHGYADYSQYLRGMKTVGDQTAAGLYGNGTNLAETVQVTPGDNLNLVGKWFHPGVIYIRWDGEAVAVTVTSDEWLDAVIIGTAVANQEEGYFETTATIPTADEGEHYLSIEDSETKLIIIVNMTSSHNEWDIDLIASTETPAHSDISTFGVNPAATDGFDDDYDLIDPPPPPEGVVSYFYYPDNPTTPVNLQKLSTSIIPPSPLMLWTYEVQPEGVSGLLTIEWDSSQIAEIPADQAVYLVCPDDSVVNMRSVVSYTFDAEAGSVYTFLIMVGGVNFDVNLAAGWNMVSFPAIPDDPSFSSIFAGAGFYQVLTWDGSTYVTPSVAEAGVGYWVLVLEETSVPIVGAVPVAGYERELAAGWSMIGSIYGEIVDAGTVFPGFYQLLTWDGSTYVSSTTIEPGKGYWALVLEPTTITVGES